jgi:ADP-heptose:LPS heptosyltransferase
MLKKELLGWSIFKSYYRLSNPKLVIFMWLFDKIGNLLFILRSKLILKPPKSILVIQLDHIGDMVLSSSLIKSIRKTYPDARVSVLIRSLALPVAKIITDIDNVLILHTPWLSREKSETWFGVLKFCIKNFKSFDLVFEVHGEPRNNFIAWMLGKFRVGTAIRGGGFLLNKSISWEREYDLHICDMQTRMLNAVTGKKNSTSPLNINIPDSVKNSVASLLKEKGIKPHDYILIQMSAGGKNREWPIENWKSLIKMITDSGLIVLCADLDSSKIRSVAPASNLFYSINVSLIEYAELVRNAKAVVSIDTFCGHVAACFQIPTLSLYSGANIWDEWRPKNDKIEYFQDKTCPKFPCGVHTCEFGYYSPCMKSITPEDVFKAFNKLLSNNT